MYQVAQVNWDYLHYYYIPTLLHPSTHEFISLLVYSKDTKSIPASTLLPSSVEQRAPLGEELYSSSPEWTNKQKSENENDSSLLL